MHLNILQALAQIKLIKIRYFIVIIALIGISWFAAITLTQQRIQLEGLNLLNNVNHSITPLVWDFTDYENQLVESSKAYWKKGVDTDYIVAKQNTNPRLSLNFSSNVINSQLHSQLEFKFQKPASLRLKIEFTTDIGGEYFYYSPLINIEGKSQTIDLNKIAWQGISTLNNPVKKVQWGAEKHKVSSLVFSFINPKQSIKIKSINLPFNKSTLSLKKIQVDCDANILGNNEPDLQLVNQFELTKICYFPSNYMWLKRLLHNRYPGSILTLKDIKPISDIGFHTINKVYTNIFSINIIFFAWLLLILIVVLIILVTNKAQTKRPLKAFDLFDFTAMLKAYSYILIPSVLVFILLYLQRPVTFSAFEYLGYYFIWAMFQQIVLVYVIAEKIFYTKLQNKLVASMFAALIFASMHLPSVTLFLLTFLAGLFWSYMWLNYRRIIPLALSHSLLALTLYQVISDKYLYSAKVFYWFWK